MAWRGWTTNSGLRRCNGHVGFSPPLALGLDGVDKFWPETERLALILARNGQSLFKARVAKIETRCRVAGVDNPVHLRASHCKPWRDATNEERLNGENGLLLTPSVDHLFDRGFIGFEDDGTIIVSPVAHRPSLQRMGVETQK